MLYVLRTTSTSPWVNCRSLWLSFAVGVGVAATPIVIARVLTLMTIAFALSAWARAGLYCNHQDLSPKYASALLGISNTAGALPGVLGVASAGYILDLTNSWSLAVFLPTAVVQLFGVIVYTKYASSVRRHDWR